MYEYEISGLLYKVALLALIIPAYLYLRGNPKTELKFALIWVIIIGVLVLGWSLLH